VSFIRADLEEAKNIFGFVFNEKRHFGIELRY
jgi:hypothetical protein